MEEAGSNLTYTFADLFAGIGGIRMGFERAGADCVWANEIDESAAVTYRRNFGEKELKVGDIRLVPLSDIPSFDILCGGFPCQPFSIAGVSKYKALGRAHGFEDMTKGTLFYEIAKIIRNKRPAAYFLENVRNLVHHDKGRTFEVIRSTLEQELDYSFFFARINAKLVLPQSRERVFMVGFRDREIDFRFPEIEDLHPHIGSILEDDPSPKYTLSNHLWTYLKDYAEKHRKAGHGFGYGLVSRESYSRTLSARYYKDGSEILVPQEGKNPRRLTPRECARLQGFPEDFEIPVSDTQAYKQFGNAVPVPVIEIMAKVLLKSLKERPRRAILIQDVIKS